MSIVFKPKRPARSVRSSYTYADGGFDANVDGQHQLARLHQAIGLPLDRFASWASVPWRATAAECRAWAAKLSTALHLFEDTDSYKYFFIAWRDFLATCSGYRTHT